MKQSGHFERVILNLSIMFLKETFKKEDDFILMFWVKRSEYFIEGILNLFIKEKKMETFKKTYNKFYSRVVHT